MSYVKESGLITKIKPGEYVINTDGVKIINIGKYNMKIKIIDKDNVKSETNQLKDNNEESSNI